MTSTNLSAGDYLGMAAAQLDDVASMLASLTLDELDQPSLCRGWRINDVAGQRLRLC